MITRPDRLSRAGWLAKQDLANQTGRPFASGNRPVIRWIKGDGRDDEVTRSAIAQATRLFGSSVDYCLCTAEISPARARAVLAWADQPVEWWPVKPDDNPRLFGALMASGCYPDRFGYWWKWFPERVRVAAPEWILDGDMLVTGAPRWFTAWCQGEGELRVSQYDTELDSTGLYGEHTALVDNRQRLYSGLISLPPYLSYIREMIEVLRVQPLVSGHDGRNNPSEQGVVATVFGNLGATPIPLSEFPFARAYDGALNYGLGGTDQNSWGYHFSYAFRMENPHFRRLVTEGAVYWREGEPAPEERFSWLANSGGQWGVPGWSMNSTCTERIIRLARGYAGRRVLELGTSRGRFAAIMAAYGCIVTTVDKVDRGARFNLEGMGIEVVLSDAANFLRNTGLKYAFVVVDLHDNSQIVWKELWPLLSRSVEPDGVLVLCNTHLWQTPEWSEETGLRWITGDPPRGWSTEVIAEPAPGMVICHHT